MNYKGVPNDGNLCTVPESWKSYFELGTQEYARTRDEYCIVQNTNICIIVFIGECGHYEFLQRGHIKYR